MLDATVLAKKNGLNVVFNYLAVPKFPCIWALEAVEMRENRPNSSAK